MATKITTALDDDLDGGPADETVRFAAGGTEYEIDLTNKHAAAFRKQLAPFVEHARKAGRGQRRPRTTSSWQRSGDIRARAKEQDIAVSGRGASRQCRGAVRSHDQRILTAAHPWATGPGQPAQVSWSDTMSHTRICRK